MAVIVVEGGGNVNQKEADRLAAWGLVSS